MPREATRIRLALTQVDFLRNQTPGRANAPRGHTYPRATVEGELLVRRNIRNRDVLAVLCSLAVATSAQAAVDKLGRVKAGNARETPHKELAEPIDGLQVSSMTELKTYCGNLKRERALVEQELDSAVRAARLADGTSVEIDSKKLGATTPTDVRSPPKAKDPKTAANTPESREAAKNLALALGKRSTLTCLLYATHELQDGRKRAKVPTTAELVKRCYEGKGVPDLRAVDCEDDQAVTRK
jgi:hypothetical protein